MTDNATINDHFSFTSDNRILCHTGDIFDDFKPLFDVVEAYARELGTTTIWQNETLYVYHKDFDKLNINRVSSPTFFKFIHLTQDSFAVEDEIKVSLGEDVETAVSNLDHLKETLKELVTQPLPVDFYYTAEENELKEAREIIAMAEQEAREEKERMFTETLKELRISRGEFEKALKYYE